MDELLEGGARRSTGWIPVRALITDARFGARTLGRNPWFTLAAVATLAAGIGANTAMFSLANALVLNPYPFPQQDRLVLLDARHVSGQNNGTGYRDYLDWRAQSTSYEEMAIAPNPYSYTLTGLGEPRQVQAFVATVGIFKVLGVQPILGRSFTTDEGKPGGPRAIVLSYSGWQRLFGGSADALGRGVMLDGKAATVVGVLPAAAVFPGLGPSDYWAPLRENPGRDRYQHQYGVLARLKPGVSLEQAQAEISVIARRLEQQYPETNKGWGVKAMPLRQAMADWTGKPVATLFLAVSFVLLLACVNVAGLLLARASGRAREIGIRTSLGATRTRIVLQMLTESLLLAVAGGACGLLVARWIMQLMRAYAPEAFVLDATLHLDPRALAFACALTLVTGVVFGLVPALHASSAGTSAVIRAGGNAGTGSRSRNRILSALVASEIALSMALLVGAALLVRSLTSLLSADHGVRVEHLMTFALDLPQAKYADNHALEAFLNDLLGKLRTAPGTVSAAAVDTLPMASGPMSGGIEIEGLAKPADWMDATGQSLVATPGYFRTMGIPLLRGRDFDNRDEEGTMPVAVVNETLARRFFPGKDPIGHRIKDAYAGWRTIVGIVGTVRQNGPAGKDDAQIYRPHAQSPSSMMWVALRTEGDPRQLASFARDTVHSLDRDLVILKLRTMREVVSDSLAESRMLTSFLAGFAVFALLLAVVGVYGIIAYSTAQRTREFGVRVALGASRASVVTLVLRRAAALAALGVAGGIPASLVISRLIASSLYGVKPHDPLVLAGVAVLLAGVALMASYFPARRAAKVDPTVALRYE